MLPAAEIQQWIPLRECRRLPKAAGLYVLRCRANGKLYVGKSMDIQRRAYKHCRPEHFNALVSRAVLAHGAEVFEIMLWTLGEDEPALLAAEIELIALLGSRAPDGYNLTAGGEGSSGYRHPPEVLARIAAANTGKKRPAAAIEATAAANRGRVKTVEERARLRAARTGKKATDETRAKMSAARKGQAPSAETRVKMTASMLSSDKVKAQARKMATARQRVVLMWVPNSMVPIEFESVKAAAEHIGVQGSEMSNYCGGCEAKSGNRFAYLE